jgi:hypothetical protein
MSTNFTAETFTDPIFKNVIYCKKPLTEASEAARQRFADKYNKCELFPYLCAYVTKLKQKDKLNIACCGDPVMRWGKFKGTPIKDLDEGYVNWLINGQNDIYDSTKKFIGDVYYRAHPDRKKDN